MTAWSGENFHSPRCYVDVGCRLDGLRGTEFLVATHSFYRHAKSAKTQPDKASIPDARLACRTAATNFSRIAQPDTEGGALSHIMIRQDSGHIINVCLSKGAEQSWRAHQSRTPSVLRCHSQGGVRLPYPSPNAAPRSGPGSRMHSTSDCREE